LTGVAEPPTTSHRMPTVAGAIAVPLRTIMSPGPPDSRSFRAAAPARCGVRTHNRVAQHRPARRADDRGPIAGCGGEHDVLMQAATSEPAPLVPDRIGSSLRRRQHNATLIEKATPTACFGAHAETLLESNTLRRRKNSMSLHRLAAAAATTACALLLVGGTGVASAQEGPARLTQVVPISGKSTKGNKQFSGTYTIERFITHGGKIYSVGTAKGKVGSKKVNKKNVRLPANVANASAPAAGRAQASQVPPLPLPPLPPGNACPILALDLGPINLPVLGLVIRTNQIQLRIDAVQGPGNLLGNLLCGITGILNPAGTLTNTPLGQLAQILNALLALSPRTA
jgi:hypothetical protein